ncbi:DUF222 domain-containing protein [Aeromicrobium sp. UC242_57]|uniref:DUF222 domain-containing protein n=1 Tax=Aeromicrobium sp. UC242_57 TaxID=3374624 RepID=UPI00378902DD
MLGTRVDDRETIDQIVLRRQALASVEAAEAADLLDYVDRARTTGEEHGGQAQGRRRADAAVHELSLALRLPVPTVERQVARARRLRSQLPAVWQAWHDGHLATTTVEAIDRAARRLTRPESFGLLDDVAVDRVGTLTPGQAVRWLDRWVDRTEPDAAAERHKAAFADRSVTLRLAGDSMTRLTAVLSAADAAAIMRSLTGTAHQLPCR